MFRNDVACKKRLENKRIQWPSNEFNSKCISAYFANLFWRDDKRLHRYELQVNTNTPNIPLLSMVKYMACLFIHESTLVDLLEKEKESEKKKKKERKKIAKRKWKKKRKGKELLHYKT